MARQNAEFAIDQGPSKLDLMLSLFDTEMGVRTLRFRLAEGQWAGNWYDVQIISARRRHPSAKIWDIEGIAGTQGGKERVSIYYLSDTREGRMRIEDELRTHGIMETPNDARRAKALMTVIGRMITRYRDSHSDNLDEEMFKLFEKAKRVAWAEGRKSLDEAVKNIQEENR